MMKSSPSYLYPPPPPDPPGAGLDNKVSLFGWLFLCLNIILFSALIAGAPGVSFGITREDSWLESLTAVWLFLGGSLFFVTAWREGSLLRRSLYILGGMAMLFGAGEEISWGQRIFGFATPEFLMTLNSQNEFNAHNVYYGNFPPSYRNVGLFLCIAASAAFFSRKDRLFGVPLPSALLTLGFLTLLSFGAREGFGHFLGFIIFKEMGLILLFLIFALCSRQVKLAVASAAAFGLVFAHAYVNYHHVYFAGYETLDALGAIIETREYLFGIGCLLYSLELALAQGRLGPVLRGPFSRLKLPGRRVPLWLAACSLVITGSAGLIFWGNLNAGAQADDIRQTYRSISAHEPLIRSTFDVYLIEDELIYFKEPCAYADMETIFFLHLYPVDEKDLPGPAQRQGFDNLDFHVIDTASGVAFDGKCLVTRPLPGYDISRIKTGQFTSVDGRYNHLWEGEILFDAAGDFSAARQADAIKEARRLIAAGEPVIRSTFDVYLSEDTLVYVKEPCAPADTEAKFFLHLYPVNVKDLPGHRRGHGFDNLDFPFDRRGAISGERCVATVALPEYDISEISTGQFLSVDGGYNHLWEGEFLLDTGKSGGVE